jgi:hypothetical protein
MKTARYTMAPSVAFLEHGDRLIAFKILTKGHASRASFTGKRRQRPFACAFLRSLPIVNHPFAKTSVGTWPSGTIGSRFHRA